MFLTPSLNKICKLEFWNSSKKKTCTFTTDFFFFVSNTHIYCLPEYHFTIGKIFCIFYVCVVVRRLVEHIIMMRIVMYITHWGAMQRSMFSVNIAVSLGMSVTTHASLQFVYSTTTIRFPNVFFT